MDLRLRGILLEVEGFLANARETKDPQELDLFLECAQNALRQLIHYKPEGGAIKDVIRKQMDEWNGDYTEAGLERLCQRLQDTELVELLVEKGEIIHCNCEHSVLAEDKDLVQTHKGYNCDLVESA